MGMYMDDNDGHFPWAITPWIQNEEDRHWQGAIKEYISGERFKTVFSCPSARGEPYYQDNSEMYGFNARLNTFGSQIHYRDNKTHKLSELERSECAVIVVCAIINSRSSRYG